MASVGPSAGDQWEAEATNLRAHGGAEPGPLELEWDGPIVANNARADRSDNFDLTGRLKEFILGDVTQWVSRVDFWLINFPPPVHALPIGSELSSWSGRILVDADGWRFTLDAAPLQERRHERAVRQQGFVPTHACRLQRSDDEPFSWTDAQVALETLQRALSFAVSRWVTPVHLFGYSANGTLRWHVENSWRTESWQPRLSWWGRFQGADLSHYLQRYFHRDESAPRPWFQHLTRHAIAASAATDVALEASLQLSLSALETLLWEKLVPTRMSNTEYQDAKLDGQLRHLLADASMGFTIPDQLQGLKIYLTNRAQLRPDGHQHHDAPETLRHLRNDLVHPKPRGTLNPYHVEGALVDAWRLSLHYLELLILNDLGYSGTYGSRLHVEGRQEGDVEAVPWQ